MIDEDGFYSHLRIGFRPLLQLHPSFSELKGKKSVCDRSYFLSHFVFEVHRFDALCEEKSLIRLIVLTFRRFLLAQFFLCPQSITLNRSIRIIFLHHFFLLLVESPDYSSGHRSQKRTLFLLLCRDCILFSSCQQEI